MGIFTFCSETAFSMGNSIISEQPLQKLISYSTLSCLSVALAEYSNSCNAFRWDYHYHPFKYHYNSLTTLVYLYSRGSCNQVKQGTCNLLNLTTTQNLYYHEISLVVFKLHHLFPMTIGCWIFHSTTLCNCRDALCKIEIVKRNKFWREMLGVLGLGWKVCELSVVATSHIRPKIKCI